MTNHLKKEDLMKHSSQVFTTYDYALFSPIDGNRVKSLLHINRLKKSMRQNYLFTIIIVNDQYEIIDGQHRFDVIKELNLPLHYVVCTGYGLDEVHILNQNSKTWNIDDYLTGYCSLGYKQYIKYAEFKKKHGIGHQECLNILGGSVNHKTHAEAFYTGKFEIKNIDEAETIVAKIHKIATYYAGYKRRSFIYAMLQMFKNLNFDFDEFMQKLKLQPTALKDCTTTTQYVALIEEIYNYRRKDKVGLRF
jgi:hypothetical protein